MEKRSRIVGNHVYFFREGDAYTVPTAGTAGRDAKPGITDTAWIDLGVVNNLSFEPSSEVRELFAPSPGQLRLYDVLETKRKLGIKFQLDELSPHTMELAFGTLPLNDDDDQYNPLEGPTKRGWLHVEQYDDQDELLNTVEVWCHIKVAGSVEFGDQVVSPQIEVNTLHSTLNTGTLVAST